MEYYEGRCLNCEEMRENPTVNAYLVIGENKKVPIGLCKKCHSSVKDFDFEKMAREIHKSEVLRLERRGKEPTLADSVKSLPASGIVKITF